MPAIIRLITVIIAIITKLPAVSIRLGKHSICTSAKPPYGSHKRSFLRPLLDGSQGKSVGFLCLYYRKARISSYRLSRSLSQFQAYLVILSQSL